MKQRHIPNFCGSIVVDVRQHCPRGYNASSLQRRRRSVRVTTRCCGVAAAAVLFTPIDDDGTSLFTAAYASDCRQGQTLHTHNQYDREQKLDSRSFNFAKAAEQHLLITRAKHACLGDSHLFRGMRGMIVMHAFDCFASGIKGCA